MNVTGVLDNRNSLLSLDAATGPWRLINGTIWGGTILSQPTLLSVSSNANSPGKLDGVTLNGDLLVSEGARLSIAHDLVLNGALTISNDARLEFSSGDQNLSGSGQMYLSGPGFDFRVYLGMEGPTNLTVESGITIHGVGGITQNYGSTLLNRGTIDADVAGEALSVLPGYLSNEGTMRARSGGTLLLGGGGRNAGILSAEALSTVEIANRVVAMSAGSKVFGRGTIRFTSVGSIESPQTLEVISQDRGAFAIGYDQYSVLGLLDLKNSVVRLANNSVDTTGFVAEALYSNFIRAASDSSLDLNGLNLYARAAEMIGTVSSGTVALLPDGGQILLNTPTPGNISLPSEVDTWTFFGRARRQVSISLNPGNGADLPLFSHNLGFAKVSVLDPTGATLAVRDNFEGTSGDVIAVFAALPIDGNYQVHVESKSYTAGLSSTGSYTVTVWDSTTNTSALTFNSPVYGILAAPYSVDLWTFAGNKDQTMVFTALGVTDRGTTFDLIGPSGVVIASNL